MCTADIQKQPEERRRQQQQEAEEEKRQGMRKGSEHQHCVQPPQRDPVSPTVRGQLWSGFTLSGQEKRRPSSAPQTSSSHQIWSSCWATKRMGEAFSAALLTEPTDLTIRTTDAASQRHKHACTLQPAHWQYATEGKCTEKMSSIHKSLPH